jgi:hypothetical protein
MNKKEKRKNQTKKPTTLNHLINVRMAVKLVKLVKLKSIDNTYTVNPWQDKRQGN